MKVRKHIDNKSLYMRVFYLYDTFAHNECTFILISHLDFKQPSSGLRLPTSSKPERFGQKPLSFGNFGSAQTPHPNFDRLTTTLLVLFVLSYARRGVQLPFTWNILGFNEVILQDRMLK